MAQPFPILLAVGAIAGASGAAVSIALNSTDSSSNAPAVDTDDLKSMSSDVSALAQENKELRSRLERLESDNELLSATPVRSAASNDQSPVSIGDDELNEMRALLAQLKNPATSMPPHFESWVKEAQVTLDKQKAEERAAQRAERDAARMEERMAKYSAELGLNTFQADEMRKTLENQSQMRNDMFTAMRGGDMGSMSRDEMREQFGQIRTETNTALENLLTPSQFEQYEGMDNNDGGRRGGGNNGGGGGGRRGGN
jgi:hypothetical protein